MDGPLGTGREGGVRGAGNQGVLSLVRHLQRDTLTLSDLQGTHTSSVLLIQSVDTASRALWPYVRGLPTDCVGILPSLPIYCFLLDLT